MRSYRCIRIVLDEVLQEVDERELRWKQMRLVCVGLLVDDGLQVKVVDRRFQFRLFGYGMWIVGYLFHRRRSKSRSSRPSVENYLPFGTDRSPSTDDG